MPVLRFPENPVITPAQVPPSRPDFEVVCAFNAGVACYRDETILLLRVAERPCRTHTHHRIPVVRGEGTASYLEIVEFAVNDPTIDAHDPRVIFTPEGAYLTTLSHLRLARSYDGRHFIIEPTPAIMPDCPEEAFGTEDPRITEIDGTYYITYKSVGPTTGITVSLAATRDFVSYEKMGMIFGPENLDVVFFPERINECYVALHRPVSKNLAGLNMWLASSPDMLHWGRHRLVMTPRTGYWDNARIGASAVPIKTSDGWLEIYHGATPDDHYCLGAVLLDLHEPHRILARSREPLMAPEASYETTGFLPNVLFSCGAITEDNRITVYYGAADELMAGAELQISEVLASLEPVENTTATIR